MAWNFNIILHINSVFIIHKNLFRVTTCLENLEMSGILTAVREMSGILLKVPEMSRKKLGKVVKKLFIVSCIFAPVQVCSSWSTWLSGRTSVSGQRSFAVVHSTCNRRVITYVGKPSPVGQPTQPFILSGSINE